MRITFNMMYLKNQKSINDSLETFSTANDKVNKGRNLLNPEDDPVYYASAINVQRMLDEADQFKRNAENALTWITNEDSYLQSASSLISKAKNEYALAGLNDSQDATSRKALANDVKNILDSFVDIGNAKFMDRYIFAGYKTDTKPFASDSKEIKGISTLSGTGVDLIKRRTFADMKELSEGNYTVEINKLASNDLVEVIIRDSRGEKVFLDSNGSDESAKDGNMISTSMIVKYEPGKVINTGVGFGIKLPDDDYDNFVSTKMGFYYVPGDDIKYHGDNGKINTKIGYNQNVTLNLTGQEVFLETSRILRGTSFNTVNNLPITETSRFSDIDGANVATADFINVSGTDHNGLSVGTAKVLAVDNVKLDMTDASESERTLYLSYGNYQELNGVDNRIKISMSSKGYSSINDVVMEINNQLSNQGLGDEIKAYADGDKIMFATVKAGKYVKLQVEGGKDNVLGFTEKQEGVGKSRNFFLYDADIAPSLSNSMTVDWLNDDGDDTNKEYRLNLNGNIIYFNSRDTESELIEEINNALGELGLNYKVDGVVHDTTNNTLQLNISYVNVDPDSNTYFYSELSDGTNTDSDFSQPVQNVNINDSYRVSDFLNFIEELYDNSVDARIENGQLVVEDLRTGKSRFTLKLAENNQGIGVPTDYDVTLDGRYTGTMDATWVFSYDSVNDRLDVTSDGIQIASVPGDLLRNGGLVDVAYGVKIAIDPDKLTSGFTFSADLKANDNLNFGDMNVVQDGENVSVFRTLKNLYDALNLNIAQGGISAPSAWRDDTLKSTAKPYLDGEFRGNYNDEWVYEVLPEGNKSSFYLQKELSYAVGSQITSPTNIDFSLVINGEDGVLTHDFNLNVSSADDLVEQINDELDNDINFDGLGVKAELKDGNIVFTSGAGTREISIVANNSDTADIFYGDNTYENTVVGQKDILLDLSEYSSDNIPLTFYYDDGTGLRSESISIPAKLYESESDLLDEIQSSLNNNGIPVTADIVDGKLVFSGSGADLLHVSGDYDGTLGFYTAGDEVKIKVSSSETGELINEMSLDTANETEYVADGVVLGFDTGTLYATDSFTSTVGSGIDYELPKLDRAETQIHESLTIVGTRQNRVDSVINFHTTFTTTNEEIKAKYLGAREVDMTDAITQLQLAQQAYEAALAATTKILQTSILDYLR